MKVNRRSVQMLTHRLIFGAALTMAFGCSVSAQSQCIRIMKQDSTLNNIVDPPGYQTAKLGTLGKWKKIGTGAQNLILIPGLGFSGGIFDEFMDRHQSEFTMYAITLPGFGGTQAPPLPDTTVSYGEQTWTNGALTAIESLIDQQHITKPIVVGHWLTGTQLAIRLALKHPGGIRGVILFAGSAKMMVLDPKYVPYYATPEKRVATIDKYFVPLWFKTVTRETWDDNNFMPGDYAVNQVRGLRLWREAATPHLHVWIRYLSEFNAQDIMTDVSKLNVPILLLKPDFSTLEVADSANNYMEAYCNLSWGKSLEGKPNVVVKTIPDSRACLWYDQPEECDKAIAEFVQPMNQKVGQSTGIGN